MELNVTRETLRFERWAASAEEQVAIEGEATLPGSMRDAVTVLSIQAQAHLAQAQAGEGEVGVRGRVCFQVLYTQGDLTRIRSIETTCDFDHAISMKGVRPGMRAAAEIDVQETNGTAGNGRMSLRALVAVRADAFEAVEQDAITGVTGGEQALQMKMQTIAYCCHEMLGEDKTLVREEFELPAKLEVLDVLCATGRASVSDMTGGNGRVGVSGTIDVHVWHRPQAAGEPLVMTVHEVPFEVTIPAQLTEGVTPQAQAEVIDVMADSAADEKRRTLRVEAEVRVRLTTCRQQEAQLLEDLYSTEGPVIEPTVQEVDVHTFEETAQARESARVQASLPADAQPVDKVLAAYAQPILASLTPAGRRLDAEGVMNMTLVYLPVDSDIPVSMTTREPFALTFPIEATQGVRGRMTVLECSAAAVTRDRVEVRCVLGLEATQHGARRVRIVTDVNTQPEERREHGFMLVWPAPGETKWDTAKRLRVSQESLRPAGKSALLAFKR